MIVFFTTNSTSHHVYSCKHRWCSNPCRSERVVTQIVARTLRVPTVDNGAIVYQALRDSHVLEDGGDEEWRVALPVRQVDVGTELHEQLHHLVKGQGDGQMQWRTYGVDVDVDAVGHQHLDRHVIIVLDGEVQEAHVIREYVIHVEIGIPKLSSQTALVVVGNCLPEREVVAVVDVVEVVHSLGSDSSKETVDGDHFVSSVEV